MPKDQHMWAGRPRVQVAALRSAVAGEAMATVAMRGQQRRWRREQSHCPHSQPAHVGSLQSQALVMGAVEEQMMRVCSQCLA